MAPWLGNRNYYGSNYWVYAVHLNETQVFMFVYATAAAAAHEPT